MTLLLPLRKLSAARGYTREDICAEAPQPEGKGVYLEFVEML